MAIQNVREELFNWPLTWAQYGSVKEVINNDSGQQKEMKHTVRQAGAAGDRAGVHSWEREREKGFVVPWLENGQEADCCFPPTSQTFWK